MTRSEIEVINHKNVGWDEFHLCNAKMYCKGVQDLLSAYRKFQFSDFRRQIHHLESQRDLADVFINGKIVSSMILGEAIIRGTLDPSKNTVKKLPDEMKKDALMGE